MRSAVAVVPILIASAIDAIFRRGSADAERRARAHAIHQLTRDLARAVDPADVARILTEAAIDSMDATGAYLERLLPSEVEVQVVGAAGVGVPRLGARMSVLPETPDPATPVAIVPPVSASPRATVVEGRGRRIASLPLRTNGRFLGSLVLLRAAPGPAFDEPDLIWGRALADIGAFALDRCLALRRELDFRGQVMDIIESVTDPFVTLDGDGRITYLNATAQQVSRRCFPTGDSLIGHVFWAAIPELRHDGVRAAFRHILEHRQPLHVEWLAPKLGGWLEIHAYPWKHGVAAYGREVNDRKDAEARLVESETRLRTVANHLPDAAIFQAVGDPSDGLRFTYISEGIARLNAAATEAIRDRPAALLDQLNEPSRAALAASVAESLRSLAPFRIELEAADGRGDGDHVRRWYELAAEPRRPDGGPLTWDGLLVDVTRRKHAELELVRLTEGRARLLRGFSHDMKNPLGAAAGLAQLLELGDMGDLNAQQRDMIARIRASVHTALDLIDDVLDLARAESGGLDLERTAVDVSALVADLIERHRPQALARGLTLERTAATGHPRAMCDPKRVDQVIGNLLTNAIKYTSHGRVVVDIATRPDGPAKGGPFVTVSVRDTGVGIPPDKREMIFEEFTRLDGTAEGAGVGLSISRRVARLMGGEITVSDAEGGGAIFTLWLPAESRRRAAARASQ
jgi:signal transduction histidine kinase